MKELDRTTIKLLLKWMLIERWRRPSMLSSMRQHVTRLQFDSCAEKDSLCGTVSHDGLNLTCLDQCHVFVPTAKAPPKAGAKELSYNSLNLAWKTTPTIADSILVSDQTDLFSFATHRDEYGMPRKALPRKQAKVDTGHQYSAPGPSPRLFSNERTW